MKFTSLSVLLVAGALALPAAAQNPWTNLPTGFQTANGYADDFESYGGVVPPHMATHALDAVTYLPDVEAWCDIAGGSGIGAASGVACLEMGLLPGSTNYHDVLNGLVVGLDGTSAGADLWLDFQVIDHGEETDTWDGVWVSDDGLTWTQVSGWGAATSTWGAMDDMNISNTGASTAGQFYLLFAQDDNFPYGYLDGIGVDDLNVDTTPPPPPAILHTEVNPANGHTYHLLEVSKWSEAQAAAVTYGGNLATLDDLAEHDWVALTFGNWGGVQRSLWIGLTDENVEGTFEWVDGTPVSFTNWANNEPNNSTANDPVNGEDYVFLYPGGGKWNDLHDTDTSTWFANLCGVVEIPGSGGPLLNVTGLVAGSTATIAVSNATPSGLVRHGYSPFGGGPVITPYGDLLLSPPYTELPAMSADANGDASLSIPVPAGTTGVVVWFHAFDVGSLSFTNGISRTIG